MRRILPFVLAAVALAHSGCSNPTAPEGFQLALQMQNVRVAAIDELRVSITPRMEATMPEFPDMAPMTYEGGITVSASAGILVITIPGDYVRAHGTATETTNPRLVLEVWSDDERMRMGPQVRATVIRASEQIATGTAYLLAWPLPLGAETQVNVPCRAGFETQCLPPTP